MSRKNTEEPKAKVA